MKCDRCGLESDVEQAFSKEKRYFGKPGRYCPDCTSKRQTRSFVRDLAIMTGSGIVVYLLAPHSRLATIILAASLVFLSLVPLVIIHELTHAVVARALGLRVFGILIGVGRMLWSGKFLGMDWYVNIAPLSGITFVGAPPIPKIRWRLFFVFLAGPASHVLLALALYFLMPFTAPFTVGRHLINILIIVNIVLTIANLIPHKVTLQTGEQGTDGWHLMRVLWLTDAELTQRHVGYFSSEALQSYTSNDFDRARSWIEQALALDHQSVIARNIAGIIQMANGEYQAARETFQQLLQQENPKESGTHFILLNNLAYLSCLLNDPTLLPEADQYSAEAYKHLPWIPPVIGTRGTVLVELGQYEEGIALLQKSMSLHNDKQGKALNACHLAIAECRRGNTVAARKYLASAKTLDPRCVLLARVEAELSLPSI